MRDVRRGSAAGGVTRRRALQLGAATAGLLAFESTTTVAAEPMHAARERSFDEGWRFFRGDAAGAQSPAFDDGAWRVLDLPHDWSIEDLPHATNTNGAATADPSLLVPQTPPTIPDLPDVIGPFDPAGSAGGGSIGYTVGGIGWYRKEFRLGHLDDRHGELRFD